MSSVRDRPTMPVSTRPSSLPELSPGRNNQRAAFTILDTQSTQAIPVSSQVSITKQADHGDATSRYMQKAEMYVQKNGEYPVKAGVPLSALQNSWGSFKADSLSLAVVADHRAAAIRLADEVGYNN